MRNKNGIPICTGKPISNKRMKRQQEVQKLNYNQFAEFKRFDVTISIPNMKPLIETMKNDGWTFVKLTKGEIV